jgi:hypothetical protein
MLVRYKNEIAGAVMESAETDAPRSVRSERLSKLGVQRSR